MCIIPIGGSKGGRQGRAPPWGSKFFHFHAVFGKKLKNKSTFGSWRPPPGENPGSATDTHSVHHTQTVPFHWHNDNI